MAKFRKKPVVIDAIRFESSDAGRAEAEAFVGAPSAKCNRCGGTGEYEDNGPKPCMGCIVGDGYLIATLEGQMLALDGDWIICGVKGEFYPCKDDIFQQTYEKVEE